LREAACKEFAKTDEISGSVPDGWIRLNSAKPQYADRSIFIEINGCHITVKGSTNLELLKNICSVLRSL